jgi:hypothetical protein
MTFPVFVEPQNGHFTAVVVGAPSLRATGASQTEALETLREELSRRMAGGQLVVLDVPSEGLAALAGRFKDDPTLREICDEIYRERNAERDTMGGE